MGVFNVAGEGKGMARRNGFRSAREVEHGLEDWVYANWQQACRIMVEADGDEVLQACSLGRLKACTLQLGGGRRTGGSRRRGGAARPRRM